MILETNDTLLDFSNAALLDEEFDSVEEDYVSVAEHKFPAPEAESY